jgi:hypothetical protein
MLQDAERDRRERKFAAETGTTVVATKTTAVAVPDNRPARDQYLDEIAPASIIGRLIKFKKGKFVLTDDDTEIGEDEDFVCLADATMIGWVRFRKDAPPDRIMGRWCDDFVMPEREELGDLDQSKWETGLDNKPADPWQHTIYLVLQKPTTQEFFTFVAATVTSRTHGSTPSTWCCRSRRRRSSSPSSRRRSPAGARSEICCAITTAWCAWARQTTPSSA